MKDTVHLYTPCPRKGHSPPPVQAPSAVVHSNFRHYPHHRPLPQHQVGPPPQPQPHLSCYPSINHTVISSPITPYSTATTPTDIQAPGVPPTKPTSDSTPIIRTPIGELMIWWKERNPGEELMCDGTRYKWREYPADYVKMRGSFEFGCYRRHSYRRTYLYSDSCCRAAPVFLLFLQPTTYSPTSPPFVIPSTSSTPQDVSHIYSNISAEISDEDNHCT